MSATYGPTNRSSVRRSSREKPRSGTLVRDLMRQFVFWCWNGHTMENIPEDLKAEIAKKTVPKIEVILGMTFWKL